MYTIIVGNRFGIIKKLSSNEKIEKVHYCDSFLLCNTVTKKLLLYPHSGDDTSPHIVTFKNRSGDCLPLKICSFVQFRMSLYLLTTVGKIFSVPMECLSVAMESQDYSLAVKEYYQLEKEGSCKHGKTEIKVEVFTQMGAGEDHMVLLSSSNDVYVVGKGPQLGLCKEGPQDVPVLLEYLRPHCTNAFECGKHHTVALLEYRGDDSEDDPVPEEDLFLASCNDCQNEHPESSEHPCRQVCPLGLTLDLAVDVPLSPDGNPSPYFDPSDDNDSHLSPFDITDDASLYSSPNRAHDPANVLTNNSNTEGEVASSQLFAKSFDIKENVSQVATYVVEGVRTISDKLWTKSLSLDHKGAPKGRLKHPKVLEHQRGNSFDLNLLSKANDVDLNNQLCVRRTRSYSKCDTLDFGADSVHSSCDTGNFIAAIHPKNNPARCEVWVWGQGLSGQLGLNNLLPLSQPASLPTLSQQLVVRVACGVTHTLALTLDGCVYGWGSNRVYQLGGLQSPQVLHPERIMMEGDPVIKAISAGENHSILCTVGGVLYYLGESNSNNNDGCCRPLLIQEETSEESNSQTQSICHLQSQGPYYILITREQRPFESVLTSLLLQEKIFLRKLKCISHSLVTPLLKHPTLLRSAHYPSTLHSLLASFSAYLDSYVYFVEHLEVVTYEEVVSWDQVLLVSELHHYAHLSETHAQILFDLIAVSGFQSLDNQLSCLEGSKITLVQCLGLAPEVSMASIFEQAMHLPYHQVGVVSVTLTTLGKALEKEFPQDAQLMLDSAHKWSRVQQQLAQDRSLAVTTQKFWETCPTHLSESLKVPHRWFIVDSKTHPVNLVNTSRFTNHHLVLLTDLIIHMSGSNWNTNGLATAWVESLADTDTILNGISITFPEETLVLSCPSVAEKNYWVNNLQMAINDVLASKDKKHHSAQRITPPLVRHATYKFTKHPTYSGATYTGMWFCGMMYDKGVLSWPDGKKQFGKFRQNQLHGYGITEIPSLEGKVLQEGFWANGKLNGFGKIKYANGDVYEGYFQDNHYHGHGTLKKGQLIGSAASIYIGSWEFGVKHGYGVMDDIAAGVKYMGMWQGDNKHGPASVITLDGVYYEGTFLQNKMVGAGLMLLEDNTCFEGEFNGMGVANGKGVLTMSNGDRIEGVCQGEWTLGIKVNGLFTKQYDGVNDWKNKIKSKLGQYCTPALNRWSPLFVHCCRELGLSWPCQHLLGSPEATKKAWNQIAIIVSRYNRSQESQQKFVYRSVDKSHHIHHTMDSFDELEKIPQFSDSPALGLDEYRKIETYLEKAFSAAHHPLGNILHKLVDAYRATYIAVGAHPRLLFHAVSEIHTMVSRLYAIIKILFPKLPKYGEELLLDTDQNNSCIITAAGILHPILLPRIYPSLFTLYALYNEKTDDAYWERLLKWNKQADIALLNFLGVDQKFWISEEREGETSNFDKLPSASRDEHFLVAIEALQQLITTFCPHQKLQVLQNTFHHINKTVASVLGDNMWSMDALFPVFQYVVVRARIKHLGSEIHLIEDLMESHLYLGELGIMFTTLQACYYQIQNEKLHV